MRIKTYDVNIKDSILNPQESIIGASSNAHFKTNISKNDRTYYKVYIYLEGKDLPFVKRIKYKLHDTFRNPIRTIERTPNNPNCVLVIWTWGLFKIKAEIEDTIGNKFVVEHQLIYGQEINDENINWIPNK